MGRRRRAPDAGGILSSRRDQPGPKTVGAHAPLEGATPWVWRSLAWGLSPDPLTESFFSRRTETVARELLGCRLRSSVGGRVTEGVIVETEAYVGPHDPASHAAARIGKTPRNEAMFGPPGRVYVFRSYGLHWCLNVVTEELGFPAAVLIRALDPVGGLEHIRERRSGRDPLCSGPGRVGQAMGISAELNHHSLSRDPLILSAGWAIQENQVGVSGRIGIREASDWPLRFYVKGHPEVSGRPR